MNAWFDNRTKEEVLNSTIFDLVQKTIGTPGLVGLDKLLSFMIVKELQVRERYFFYNISRQDIYLRHSYKSYF